MHVHSWLACKNAVQDASSVHHGVCEQPPRAATAAPLAPAAAPALRRFSCLMRHRKAAGATSSLLDGVTVPREVGHEVLQAVVGALYEGRIQLGADNLEPVVRLADAMRVRPSACRAPARRAPACSAPGGTQLDVVVSACIKGRADGSRASSSHLTRLSAALATHTACCRCAQIIRLREACKE